MAGVVLQRADLDLIPDDVVLFLLATGWPLDRFDELLRLLGFGVGLSQLQFLIAEEELLVDLVFDLRGCSGLWGLSARVLPFSFRFLRHAVLQLDAFEVEPGARCKRDILAVAELPPLTGMDVQADDREVQAGVEVACFFRQVLQAELAELWFQHALSETMSWYRTQEADIFDHSLWPRRTASCCSPLPWSRFMWRDHRKLDDVGVVRNGPPKRSTFWFPK